MAAESAFVKNGGSSSTTTAALFSSTCKHSQERASNPYTLIELMARTGSTNNWMEDAVLRAEMLAPLALELEEERQNEQEQLIRDYDLWDDTAKSNDILAKLADSVRVVDALKDLTCERSHFADKMKAMNRLKAKLLILALEQGVTKACDIKKDEIVSAWQKEIRRHMSHPHKLVKDVKMGIELPDLMSVLDGNLEPLIAAHINTRQKCDMV